jgi:transcriptional regulator with XRE-family HTH domain
MMSDSDSRRPTGRPRRARHTAKEHGPDPIDLHVGGQLRVARELAGLTQTEVGRELGMSFQVIQKYEQGEIRVSASRLFQLAVLLDKSPDYFFDGILGSGDAPNVGALDRGDIELIRAFRTVRNPELRQLLVRLARDIVEKGGTGSDKDDK